MKKENALKELQEIKSYAVTNTSIEKLLPHMLTWSIIISIALFLNFLIRTSTEGIYVIPMWIIAIIIGIILAVKIESKTKKQNEKISLIDKHTGLIWAELISLGVILTGLSLATPMMDSAYIPVIWFLIIGIGEALYGTIGKLKIFYSIGILNVIFGTFLSFNLEILTNYWEFFFIISEGLIGILYYTYKKLQK